MYHHFLLICLKTGLHLGFLLHDSCKWCSKGCNLFVLHLKLCFWERGIFLNVKMSKMIIFKYSLNPWESHLVLNIKSGTFKVTGKRNKNAVCTWHEAIESAFSQGAFIVDFSQCSNFPTWLRDCALCLLHSSFSCVHHNSWNLGRATMYLPRECISSFCLGEG